MSNEEIYIYIHITYKYIYIYIEKKGLSEIMDVLPYVSLN